MITEFDSVLLSSLSLRLISYSFGQQLTAPLFFPVSHVEGKEWCDSPSPSPLLHGLGTGVLHSSAASITENGSPEPLLPTSCLFLVHKDSCPISFLFFIFFYFILLCLDVWMGWWSLSNSKYKL